MANVNGGFLVEHTMIDLGLARSEDGNPAGFLEHRKQGDLLTEEDFSRLPAGAKARLLNVGAIRALSAREMDELEAQQAPEATMTAEQFQAESVQAELAALRAEIDRLKAGYGVPIEGGEPPMEGQSEEEDTAENAMKRLRNSGRGR